ncbi:hypothetical protein TNCV_2926821 [Trichonephila clavipes]|nr:hypothetical protein TNCV_2926821 [Trichonephila clavipes]
MLGGELKHDTRIVDLRPGPPPSRKIPVCATGYNNCRYFSAMRERTKKPIRESSRLNRNHGKIWPLWVQSRGTEAIANFRLIFAHDFLGVYLHWLDLTADEVCPLCGHARKDGDHPLQCAGLDEYPIDDVVSRSVLRGLASNGQEAKRGPWKDTKRNLCGAGTCLFESIPVHELCVRVVCPFSRSRESVSYNPHSGRLATSVSDENIEKERKLVPKDRQLAVCIIADELQINREPVRQMLPRIQLNSVACDSPLRPRPTVPNSVYATLGPEVHE